MNVLYAFLALILCDSIYISGIKEMFGNMIQHIQKSEMKPNIFKVIFSYFILYIFALYFIPKLDTYIDTFMLGFLTYGIYETTNYAIFDNWDYRVVIIDSIWGGILMCLVRFAGTLK